MVDYEFDSARRLLVTSLSGVVRASDFDVPDVPVGTRELLDTTRADSTEFTSSEVRRLASLDIHGPDRISQMAIVADTECGFGLARMYQSLSESMQTEVRVFREAQEALTWLGLESG